MVKSDFLKNMLLFFISIVTCIFILEIISRKAFVLNTAKVILKGDLINSDNYEFKLSSDHILLYEWKRLPKGAIKNKEKNTFRILVLGDSITYRSMWTSDDYYPELLQALLNVSPISVRYEVINAGMPGYNTSQEARYLEKRLLSSSPNMVILGYCSTNDRAVKRKFIKYPDGLYSSDVVESYPYILDFPFNEFLLKNSSFYKCINFTLAAIINKFNFNKIQVKYFDSTFETESAIKKIKHLSDKNKFNLLFVIFPALANGPQYECDWVVGKCQLYGIAYIDLRNIFGKTGYEKLKISDDDFCHPNKLGQNLAAEQISEYLNKHNLLKKEF